MSQRETISKKLRFEIFKRDKFTCQYCGEKAPEVVLNIDHINPVANGGNNEILNLITSCFSCNNGKRDRKLDDSSAIEKQRKQLELLEERREQLTLMLEWKNSLSDFDNDVVDMISNYVNSKIKPFGLNDQGKLSVANWLKKHTAEKILDAIDISAKQYIKYQDGNVTSESAESFIKKIGGIIYNNNLPPIKQKLNYIKGIARNRFSYWDDKKGAIILSNYVNALQVHYDENRLLQDLEDEVIKVTKDSENWSQWKSLLEKWTSDIEKWEKPREVFENLDQREQSQDQLDDFVSISMYEQENQIEALAHIGMAFSNFDKLSFRDTLYRDLINFLENHNSLDDGYIDRENANEYIRQHIESTEATKLFSHGDLDDMNWGIKSVLHPIALDLLVDIFTSSYFPAFRFKKEYKDYMIQLNISLLMEKVLPF